MKNFYLMVFLLSFNTMILAQEAESGQSLDDVIVKETYQAGSEEEKLPVYIDADFTNIVEIKERLNWGVVDWTITETNAAPEFFDFRFSSPELTEIIPEPAKMFHVNFEELANWKLEIFTSDGNVFRNLKGEGHPPSAIAWDGRGNSGEPLIPGEQYAYSFIAVDKAGNSRTFPGEGFSINALYLSDENCIWIGISNSVLFSPDGYGLTNTAANYSRELVNFIYYYAQKGIVKIQSNHPDTGKFLQLLAENLGTEVNYFQRETPNGNGGRCFNMWIE